VISPLYQHLFVPDGNSGFTPAGTVVQAGRLAPPARLVPVGSRRNAPENSREPVHIGSVLAELAAQYGLRADEFTASGRPADEFIAFEMSGQAGPTDGNLSAVIRNQSPRSFELPAMATPALV
jgi:hypothetical protein